MDNGEREQQYQRLWDLGQKRKETEPGERDAKLKESSKRRLLRILAKKFQSTFIYDLSQFEVYFGQLWGHGRPDEDLGESETFWRKLWNELRTQILDNGNKQIRGMQSELLIYEVEEVGYQAEIQFLKGKNSV